MAGTSPAMTEVKLLTVRSPPTILLPRQLNYENFRAIARSIDRAVQLPSRAGRKRMQERMGHSRPSAAVRPAARRDAVAARAARLGATRSGAALAGHGAEILVQPPQQVDQDFPLVFLQAGQQPPFAFERGHDHLVVDRPPP